MPAAPVDHLRSLVEELRGLAPQPWSEIAVWTQQARPLILQRFSPHLATFDALTKPPFLSQQVKDLERNGIPRYVNHPERFHRERYPLAEMKDKESKASYPKRCESQRRNLLAFLDGVVRTSESTLPTSPTARHLHALLEELKTLKPHPWDDVEDWAARARPAIVHALPVPVHGVGSLMAIRDHTRMGIDLQIAA